MQLGIRFLLRRSGLNNEQLISIILADQTSYPIKSMLQAMVGEVCNLDESDRQIASKIFKRVGELIEKRNDVIHSTWFVGWASTEATDFGEIDGHKLSKGKDGASIKGFKYTKSNFELLANECELVAKLVHRLCGLLATGNYKLSNNFVLDNDGSINLPPNG